MMAPLDQARRLALADAALRLGADRPWREVTVFDLAAAASLEIVDVAGVTPGDTLDFAEELFDREMARGLRGVDGDTLVRDRLFDVVMRRFEAMERHRAGLIAMEGGGRDPAQLAVTHARHVRAARWALALAGVEAEGVAGAARAQGLAVILTQVRGVWRMDPGGDFAKTMAALDKALRRAERTFGRAGGFDAPPPREPPPQPGPEPAPQT